MQFAVARYLVIRDRFAEFAGRAEWSFSRKRNPVLRLIQRARRAFVAHAAEIGRSHM